jgi:glycosyltransferase involved in cell wall biosynthesis
MHTLYKTVKHFVKEDIDVVHAVNLDIMPLAVKLKRKYGCKIVYDLLEMYAFMVSPKPGSAVEGYYLRKDKRMWKHVDYVFTMTDITYKWMSYLLSVLTKNKCPPIVTVANSKLLQYERYREPSRDRPFILLYLGTIAKSRFLKETIEVVETFGGKINFIIGGIPQTSLYYKEVVAMCKKYKHSQFIGQIPHTEVIPMTRGCDAVLCMIDPKQRNSARALANKQHEAMVTGRPIITTQGTHPGNMTLENNCGYVIKYNKYWLHFALKAFFKYPQLSKVFGQNALQMAKNKYNWSFDAARMLAAYKELMS